MPPRIYEIARGLTATTGTEKSANIYGEDIVDYYIAEKVTSVRKMRLEVAVGQQNNRG